MIYIVVEALHIANLFQLLIKLYCFSNATEECNGHFNWAGAITWIGIEAESKFEASTSFYFEEEICLKVSPSVGERSALDQQK